MVAMDPSDAALLAEFLAVAGPPPASSVTPLTGRGFDSAVYRATLADGQRVALRRWREPRAPEHLRARFLAGHEIPAPAFLAGNERGSLHAFVPGSLLGDLIESYEDTDAHWQAVGHAYRKVHAVAFPPGLAARSFPTGSC